MSNTLPLACVETDGFLVELAYGEDSAVPASAKQHLATCERCQAELRALQGVREAASTLPMEEPSSQLDSNIFAALDAHFAGESLDSHLKQPEPAPARPKLSVVQGGAERSPPPESRKTPKRRNFWGPLAAAASVAIVAGSTWLVSRDQSPAATFAQAKQEAAADQMLEDKAPAALEAKVAEAAKPADVPAEELERNAAKDAADKNFAAEQQRAAAEPAKKSAIADFFSKRQGAPGAGGDAPLPAERLNADTHGPAANEAEQPALAKEEVVAKPMASAPAGAGLAVGNVAAAPPPPPVAPAPVVMAEPHAMAKPTAPARPDSDSLADTRSLMRSAPTATKADADESDAPAAAKTQERREVSEKKKERAASSLEETTVWTHRLNEGRDALKNREWKWADEQFASVLTFKSLPASVRREALEGRLTALDALNRTAEAEAVAEILAREFPSSPAATRAKSVPAEAAPVNR